MSESGHIIIIEDHEGMAAGVAKELPDSNPRKGSKVLQRRRS